MILKLLNEHHLEFLSLKGGCTGSSESTYVKIPHCWKSHVAAQRVHIEIDILPVVLCSSDVQTVLFPLSFKTKAPSILSSGMYFMLSSKFVKFFPKIFSVTICMPWMTTSWLKGRTLTINARSSMCSRPINVEPASIFEMFSRN